MTKQIRHFFIFFSLFFFTVENNWSTNSVVITIISGILIVTLLWICKRFRQTSSNVTLCSFLSLFYQKVCSYFLRSYISTWLDCVNIKIVSLNKPSVEKSLVNVAFSTVLQIHGRHHLPFNRFDISVPCSDIRLTLTSLNLNPFGSIQ